MPHQQIGVVIAGVGALLLLIGLAVWSGALAWFGHLPGDLRLGGGSTRIYIPITSMLLVSAVLSFLLWLARRIL